MHGTTARKRSVMLGVIVALAIPAFAVAGFWQLQRLDERRDHNALVAERRSMPVIGLDEALSGPATAEHRRVRVRGTFDRVHEIRLLGRGLEGRPGDHLLTPLVAGETAILVDRGWVPTGSTEGTDPPAGVVVITGMLLPSETAGPFGGGDGPVGPSVSRVDVARIGAGLPYPLMTDQTYLLLQTQDPTQHRLPEPAPPAELSEGSHLIYAVQWFLFIPTLLAVYIALTRSQRKKRLAMAPEESRPAVGDTL